MVPYSQSGIAAGSAVGRHWRKETRGGIIMAPLDLGFLETVFGDLEELIRLTPNAEKSIIGWELHNPNGTLKVRKTGTTFSNRGRHGTMFLVPTWTKEEYDEVCKDWCKKLDEKMMKEFRRRQLAKGVDETTRTSTGRYLNHDCMANHSIARCFANMTKFLD
jgi:hypothetical protein